MNKLFIELIWQKKEDFIENLLHGGLWDSEGSKSKETKSIFDWPQGLDFIKEEILLQRTQLRPTHGPNLRLDWDNKVLRFTLPLRDVRVENDDEKNTKESKHREDWVDQWMNIGVHSFECAVDKEGGDEDHGCCESTGEDWIQVIMQNIEDVQGTVKTDFVSQFINWPLPGGPTLGCVISRRLRPGKSFLNI